MKHRTNIQRAERKTRKLTELMAKREASKNKQIHTTHHEKPGYSAIIAQVRLKTSVQTIQAAHPGRKIERIQLMPRILWSEGTYKTKEHGRLKSA
jgi:hypothetical protein